MFYSTIAISIFSIYKDGYRPTFYLTHNSHTILSFKIYFRTF